MERRTQNPDFIMGRHEMRSRLAALLYRLEAGQDNVDQRLWADIVYRLEDYGIILDGGPEMFADGSNYASHLTGGQVEKLYNYFIAKGFWF